MILVLVWVKTEASFGACWWANIPELTTWMFCETSCLKKQDDIYSVIYGHLQKHTDSQTYINAQITYTCTAHICTINGIYRSNTISYLSKIFFIEHQKISSRISFLQLLTYNLCTWKVLIVIIKIYYLFLRKETKEYLLLGYGTEIHHVT